MRILGSAVITPNSEMARPMAAANQLWVIRRRSVATIASAVALPSVKFWATLADALQVAAEPAHDLGGRAANVERVVLFQEIAEQLALQIVFGALREAAVDRVGDEIDGGLGEDHDRIGHEHKHRQARATGKRLQREA